FKKELKPNSSKKVISFMCVPKLDVDDPTSIKKLTKLKHFSLISICYTIFYEKQIIPLLHRMTNLEELTLLLSILRLIQIMLMVPNDN
ncbi:unnamed protein product, partial [Rotaria socialis]